MILKKKLLTRLTGSLVALTLPAQYVTADSSSGEVEEIVVTGSFIKRPSQANSSSPIDVIGRETFGKIGGNTFADFVPTLTINAGDEGASDNFSGPRTMGTSNINLRGLGIGANLVLLNGRRQTQAAMTNGDGESFVDTNSLIPLIALERLEILKDGASSLYGSDAISGVVNFITRNDFDGFEIEVGSQLVPDGSQDEYNFSALWGGGNDETHIIAAVSLLNRKAMNITERDLDGAEQGVPGGASSSGFGFPGNFVTSSGVMPDPYCDAVASAFPGGTNMGVAPVRGTDQCRWDFHPFIDIVPDETHIQGYAALTHQMGNWGGISELVFKGDYSFAHNKTSRSTSPSLGPFSRPPIVPAAHPQNTFGEDVVWFGRIVGTGADAKTESAENNTWRASGVFEGNFAESWSFQAGATWSANEATNIDPDTIYDDWVEAINDFSYNPFGNSLLVGPGDPAYNSPELLARLQGKTRLVGRSELWTLDAHVTGELAELPAGPLGIAIGAQYRNEELKYDFDPISNLDGWASLTGNPDFKGDRDVSAVFVELAIPVIENLDVQLAVRYEDYGGDIGDTTDPKIAAIWQPVETFSLRASYSESFKAPTLFQTDGVGTIGSSGVFALGSFQFPMIRFQQDPNEPLTPETADVFNIGVTFQPTEKLSIDLDYWRFEFTDLIIRQGAGDLVYAALGGDPQAASQVDIDFASGLLGEIRSFYRNAQGLDTDGVDLGARYDLNDNITLTANATWVNEYEFQTENGKVDGAGFLNAGTIGAPAPELRGNIGLIWATDRQSANVYVRYIDSYEDQRANRAGFKNIDSFTTVDAQYTFQAFENTSVTIGGRNLFDEDVPTVRDFMGYDALTHDARQQLFYVKLHHAFR